MGDAPFDRRTSVVAVLAILGFVTLGVAIALGGHAARERRAFRPSRTTSDVLA